MKPVEGRKSEASIVALSSGIVIAWSVRVAVSWIEKGHYDLRYPLCNTN